MENTVNICTPTYNRRPFIPYLIECIRRQTYPHRFIEWIVVDDGTDSIADIFTDELINSATFKITYVRLTEKMPLGKKRNYIHSLCRAKYIVYMDDDDYYPPERVAHAIEMLEANPAYLIAGSSEMHMIDVSTGNLYQCGPYGSDIATAATFAFRREELLKVTQYDDQVAYTEEPYLLRGGHTTIPVLQLDTRKTILVVAHSQNSLNKQVLLDNSAQCLIKPSCFTIDDFISCDNNISLILRDFYGFTVSHLVLRYDAGDRKNKPQLNLDRLVKREEQIYARSSVIPSVAMIEPKMIINSPLFKQMKEALENKIAVLENKIKTLKEENKLTNDT